MDQKRNGRHMKLRILPISLEASSISGVTRGFEGSRQDWDRIEAAADDTLEGRGRPL